MTTPPLTPRALDLLRVIKVQAYSGTCSMRRLTRALPHDPAWIGMDLSILATHNLISVRRGWITVLPEGERI